jgi:hypothetical protein
MDFLLSDFLMINHKFPGSLILYHSSHSDAVILLYVLGSRFSLYSTELSRCGLLLLYHVTVWNHVLGWPYIHHTLRSILDHDCVA